MKRLLAAASCSLSALVVGGALISPVAGSIAAPVVGVWLDLGAAPAPPNGGVAEAAYDAVTKQLVVNSPDVGLQYRDASGTWREASPRPGAIGEIEELVTVADGSVRVYGYCQTVYAYCFSPWTGSDMGAPVVVTGLPDILGAAMVYAPAAREYVLYGGNGTAGPTAPNLTTYVSSDGISWAPVTSALNPGPFLYTGGMAYDPVIGDVVTIGGNESGCSRGCGRTTYLFDGAQWHAGARVPSLVPFDNLSTKVAYDPDTGNVVAWTLPTGNDLSVTSSGIETYTFNGRSWIPQEPITPQSVQAVVFDPRHSGVVCVGLSSRSTSRTPHLWVFLP